MASGPWAAVRDESGAILVLVLVALVVMLGSAGLAIDLGRGYVEKLRLGRAVDAGALAAARSLRLGQATARAQALALGRANGVPSGAVSVRFGSNNRGESTVTVSATRTVPTTFMRVLGHQQMDLRSTATAAVPPVDIVLVLDHSGSLGSANAWDDLQRAARDFVRHFDDGLDQMGLVSFQVRATERYALAHDFTTPIEQSIQAMRSVGDTNTGEGLRLALQQIQSGAVRPSAAKVVVFFTDGRPTATRETIGPPFAPRDRAIAVYTSQSGVVRGYFDNPDALPPDQLASPDGCANAGNCFGWNESRVRNQSRVRGLQRARDIRRAGAVLYTIGLGNPNLSDPLLQPDLDYLREIANENGAAHPNEPQGKMYFAPSAAELEAVFRRVAQDLIVRLAS